MRFDFLRILFSPEKNAQKHQTKCEPKIELIEEREASEAMNLSDPPSSTGNQASSDLPLNEEEMDAVNSRAVGVGIDGEKTS